MKAKYLSAALMAAGLLMAAPSFAQTTAAQKQHTQDGGSFEPLPCGLPYNADSKDDPDCKQHTQNLTPSPLQATYEGTKKQ